MYQVTQVLLYSLISLFGHYPIPWLLLFTFLHALNAWMIGKLMTRILNVFAVSLAEHISLLAAFLFLINPVQTDTLIWKAALHYLIGLLMMLQIFSWTISFLQTSERKFVLYILLLYFISTFTLEIFYLTPAFVFCFGLFFFISKKIEVSLFKKFIRNIFLPMVLIWFTHLLLYHWVYGKWISHYAVNISDSFSIQNIVSRLAKYSIHILGMEYFWSNDWRNKFYHFTEKNSFTTLASTAIGLLFNIVFARWNKWKHSLRLFTFFAISFMLSCTLIIPLWFNDFQLMRNDRYYYLPSVFLLLLLGTVFYSIPQVKVRNTLIMLYVALCVWGTEKIVWMTKDATSIFYNLINTYRWQDKPLVLLLNLPNNLEGINMIPARGEYFKEHLKVLGNGTPTSNIIDVTSYNRVSLYDGVHITVLNDTTIKVTLNQWGTWWWWDSKGALDYENEYYTVQFLPTGLDYMLHLKAKAQSATLIFQTGCEWKEVNKTMKEEQW